jgi:lauroyl/myristoyl acyltransferase
MVAQETYAYAKTLLDVATTNADGRPRALLVGGGIANFTDVAATFKGIIQVCVHSANDMTAWIFGFQMPFGRHLNGGTQHGLYSERLTGVLARSACGRTGGCLCWP